MPRKKRISICSLELKLRKLKKLSLIHKAINSIFKGFSIDILRAAQILFLGSGVSYFYTLYFLAPLGPSDIASVEWMCRTRITRWHMKILWKSNQPHRSINKRNRYNILRLSRASSLTHLLFGWNGTSFIPFKEKATGALFTQTNKSQILCISSRAKPKAKQLKGVFVRNCFPASSSRAKILLCRIC